MASNEHGPRMSRRELLRNIGWGGLIFVMPPVALGGMIKGIDLMVEGNRNATREKINALGIDGDLQLVDIRTIPGFNVSGGFIFGSGSFNGETKSSIQFAWKTKQKENPEVIISEMPVDQVIFNVINNKEVAPHLNFNYPPVMDLSDNPNDYVKKATIAVFTLSEQDFTNFRGNQQTSQP